MTGEEIPVAAARNPAVPSGRPGWIRAAGIRCGVPIPAPFRHISGHVVQSISVRLKMAYGRGIWLIARTGIVTTIALVIIKAQFGVIIGLFF